VSQRKKKAPKRGRPALPEGESKSVFALRLNVAEKAAIEAAAERQSKPLAQWAREALLLAAALAKETGL